MDTLYKVWNGISEAALIYGSATIPFSIGGECKFHMSHIQYPNSNS